MNEARCLGDLPGGPNCVPGTGLLSKWYKQQSDFVRSLFVLVVLDTSTTMTLDTLAIRST